MSKIQLTIKTTYLSTWDAYCGVRELVQNGRDSEIDGHPLTVSWYNQTLRIENDGAVLTRNSLLFGQTTKEGRSDQIGKFGEGLKLGVLALIRAGHPVKIRTGAEVWTPCIERSEAFDEDVLTFRIEGGREDKKRVRVEIGGISKEVWEKMKTCFLFLLPPSKHDEIVNTIYGSLLMNPEFHGKVYVKGIFVEHVRDLAWGYDLKDVDLDRDRKMVNTYDLQYHTKQTFLLALNQRPNLLVDFVRLLDDPSLEVASILDSNSSYNVSDEAAKFVANAFHEKHGENAFPVQTLAESKDLEHLGKKGIVVTKPLGTVLAKTLGDVMTAKTVLKQEVLKKFGWSDLIGLEQENLEAAIDLVCPIERVSLDDVDIVEFRSDTLMGQFKDGRCLLAKKLLVDADETLATLIHELAHRQGGDGDHSHVARLENIWKGVVSALRKK